MKWGESRSEEERARLAAKQFPFTEATRKRLGLDQSPRRKRESPRDSAPDARKAVVVLGLAVAILAVGTPAADAGGIPKRERVGTVRFELVSRTLNRSLAQNVRVCETVTHRFVAENLFGGFLWALHQRMHWCWTSDPKRRRLTKLEFTPWARVVWWSQWQFHGIVADSRFGGVGQKSGGHQIQGSFSVCFPAPRIGPICQNRLPWIRQTALANPVNGPSYVAEGGW
jgi:hypothetical protein